MKNYAITIGVDVSKAKLDACIISTPGQKEAIHMVVPNTPKGIAAIISRTCELGFSKEQMLFCFEHTGVYSMPLSLFLQAQSIDYWMVPSLEIKNSKGIRRGKSDKNDAKDIAYYALTHLHKTELSCAPEKEISKLRTLLSEREKIVKAIGMFQSTEEDTELMPKELCKEALAINKKTLTALNKRLKETDAAIAALVKAHPVMARQMELATSVPGVGKQTALYLIAMTRCFTLFSNWRKLACFAGIAPFEYSSGSSIKGRTKVSHLANKKLKSLFNMAALSAKKYDAEIGTYYERKRAEGKPVMSVMNAIRCKVVARVFAAVKRDSPFVNTMKFAA